VTRDAALARLHALSAGITEPNDEARAARLLERVTAAAEPELRDLLTELGAKSLLFLVAVEQGGDRCFLCGRGAPRARDARDWNLGAS
jgi:hypothetical protein